MNVLKVTELQHYGLIRFILIIFFIYIVLRSCHDYVKKNELGQSHCIKIHYSAQVSEDYNLSLSLFSVCKHDRQRAQVMNGQNWIKYTVITSRQPAAQWGMGPQIYHSIVWGFYQLGLPLHLWFILQFIIPDLSVCVAGVTAPRWITG